MEKEYLTLENTLFNEEENDLIINIDEFDYDDTDYDYYGAQETIRRFREELGLGEGSRALALANEFAKKEEMEKIRKKERDRLYKTDKKCYNKYENDKNCQKDKTEDRIYTRVNIRKIKKLLRYEGITYKEVADALNTSERSIIRKLNVYTDLTANELIIISDLLNIDINEIIYKNKH